MKVKSTCSVSSAAVLLCSLFIAGTLLKTFPCAQVYHRRSVCATACKQSHVSLASLLETSDQAGRQAGVSLRHWFLACQTPLDQFLGSFMIYIAAPKGNMQWLLFQSASEHGKQVMLDLCVKFMENIQSSKCNVKSSCAFFFFFAQG